MKIINTALLLLAFSCLACFGGGKPNIILILLDDAGYGDLGCYGSDFNETSHMDALASAGIKFTHAYAAAVVCSPSRAALMTGQYPVRTGISDFIGGRKHEIFLDPSRYTTINEMLQEAGYKTCHIGKWHLDGGHAKSGNGTPKEQGFDAVFGNETGYIADGDYFHPYKYINTFKRAKVPNEWLSEGEGGEFLTDRLFHEAKGFIRRNQQQPFFVYLSLYAVHSRHDAPENLVQKYVKKYEERFGKGSGDLFKRNPKTGKRGKADLIEKGLQPNANANLAAMYEIIDDNVGALLEMLDQAGLRNDTLVIIKSDNGGSKLCNNGGLRASKAWLYEGGIRVPLIMDWPGHIEPGTVSDVPVNTVDLYPTFAELSGAPLPKDQVLDGISIVPLLNGADQLDRDMLFWHTHAETFQKEEFKGSAVRKGDWKCIDWFGKGYKRTELFNLKTDPTEQTNLAQLHPEKTRELLAAIKAFRADAGIDIEKGLPDFPNPKGKNL